jgi:response regulator RpfG family c-di-GMP phosphodiesterase
MLYSHPSRHRVAPPPPQLSTADSLLNYCLEGLLIHRDDWAGVSEGVRVELQHISDRQQLLHRLVEEKLLTQYQADRLQAGTLHGLILGGMGVVFLGEHIHLRRLAAIKILPLPAGEEEGPLLTRFFNEIRVIAQLQHPNIVWAIDTGEVPGDRPEAPNLYYHVMEYVPGQDLEELVIDNGALPLTRACDLIYQVASALAEADKHHLVHRDIKPSNILVTPEGQAKLLDFGLARSFSHRQTEPGVVLGTIEYLAPEQASDASTVDIRADIYGLGGTLFWCLAARVPFPSSAPLHQQVLARLRQQPPALRACRPDLPAELDAIIARMMATNPEDRYPSPQAVMRALLPFLCSEPGEAVYLPSHHRASGSGPTLLESGGGPAGPQRVLIVDDEKVIRTLSRTVLEAEGIACDEAGTGRAALEAVRARPTDLVLLDVDMPELMGSDVLRRLRESPPWPNLKIIMASGRATSEEMAHMMLAGADDFLAKPFSMTQLTARVKAALRLKAAQDRSDALTQRLLSVNQELEQNLLSRDSDLIHARNALVLALAELVAYRGAETSAHLQRIQRYVRALAREAAALPSFASQLDPNFVQMLEGAAPLHDLGMIGLPEHILLKPGRLAADERIVMQTHTTLGAEILQKVARKHSFAGAFLQMAIDIVRHHHERWDGKGYPDRLIGADIPLAARIVGIVDVYDALRSRRPHKPALAHAAAVEVMTDASGGQFDPQLLQAFHRCGSLMEQIFKELPD